MFLTQLRTHLFLQFFITLLPEVIGSSLDCNFNLKTCCWKNRGDGSPWKIYHGKGGNDENRTIIHSRYNKNHSGRSFLATLVTLEEKFSTDWTSCPLCSKTGLVTVRLRAHQTPTTRIILCWKPIKDGENGFRHCTFLRTWYPNNSTSKHFTVKPHQYIQFYIKLHNYGQHLATATIDSIDVITEECNHFAKQSKIHSPKPYSMMAQNKEPEYMVNKILQTTIKPSTRTIPPAVPNTNSSFILKDIFGDAFAQFLVDDSDGLISKNQEVDKINHFDTSNNNLKSYQQRGISTEETLIATPVTPKPLFSFNFLECNTTGGCLFERSMCSYYNSHLSNGSIFQRVTVYNRNFVQAMTKPNTTAVLETITSFTEEHKIIFDVLEYTEGERFYGCCYKKGPNLHETLFKITTIFSDTRPPDLFCPYATAVHQTPIAWRTARFTCPLGTTKILFVCENYGSSHGTCAMDNIRVHKILDVLEVEPCQKETIAFL